MNGQTKWLRITACENIPLREGRVANVAGREIAIFNLGDRFLAVENRCPHRGGPLAEGIVSGTKVVCPLHAWKVDLETGSVANSGAAAPCVETYQTRVEEGIILLEIPLESRANSSTEEVCATDTGIQQDRPIRWIHRKPVQHGTLTTSPEAPRIS